ncbi:HDOD domain-containing protein [Curvibacter sp. CHRR-16]|uniref:HDOD domain-containing protein n=1 Tax=Curvibacter sp. CHRR-16 TaxID=2835872 RepID=UPI001BDADD21|nr:HDOD domain-containing protein [Curvibacter sp. CHRR-16]MBT0571299.1 HDOD domain-containing protein [Curvibacter sp. CHRR-16]
MQLDQLLQQPFTIPSVPKVVALLLNELGKPHIDLNRINQLISTDPALTARLLRLANSDAFGMQAEVGSVTQALALLDLSHVRTMAQEAASAASLKAVPGIVLQEFWHYSLHVARLSRSLAGLSRQNPQHAFTAGLLHAMGELGMHLNIPAVCAEISNHAAPLDLRRTHYERHKLGYCFAAVSAGYAEQWGLPQAIVDALEHQPAPFDHGVYEPLAGVIHLATWRARAELAQLSEKAIVVSYPDTVGVALGLNLETVMRQDPFDWIVHS